uniref:NADH:ubiquinone reductase (H(+)-translocating) n=1 Tax=Schistosoma margrebowiei TaxID=48269 RepID=A0A1E1GJB5_9TREM|nr:NADH dehydrogenase subunit 5 [Schistosoma margrebowiei]
MVSVIVGLFVLLILLLSCGGGSVFFGLGGVYSFIDGLMFHCVSSCDFKLILMLISCGVFCFGYVFHYISGGFESKIKLFLMMIFFSGIMMGLIFSGNLVTSLLLWEYLGLASLFLILYYGVWESYRGGIVTLVSSRFGDVGLFFIVGYYLGMGSGVSLVILAVAFWLVVVSKSASFPFISWLLEAMRAPTPVSSLVHSSTLVAAGVWFYLNYHDVVGYSVFNFGWVGDLVLMSGLAGIIVSGVCALSCNDIKQVVALSTCSNISWVIVMLSLGEVDLALVQLVVHGLSKCVIFILVGDYISGWLGGQMVNGLMVSIIGSVRDFVYLSMLVLGLSGFPFIGLYFSKHLFFGAFYSVNFYNLSLIFLLCLCLVLSVAYCVRLVILFDGCTIGNVSSIRLFYRFNWFSIIVSWVISIYYSFGIVEGNLHLLSFDSIVLLFLLIIGSFGGLCAGFGVLTVKWFSWLMGLDIVVVLINWLVQVWYSLCALVQFRWEMKVLEYLFKLVGLFTFYWYISIVLLNLCVIMLLVLIV